MLCQYLLISVVTCPSLADPENGRVIQTTTQSKPYQTVVNISCDEGYRLEGSVSRMCLSDGTWSGVETHCVCEYSNNTSYNTNMMCL